MVKDCVGIFVGFAQMLGWVVVLTLSVSYTFVPRPRRKPRLSPCPRDCFECFPRLRSEDGKAVWR